MLTLSHITSKFRTVAIFAIIQSDFNYVGVSVAYDFQTGNNKIKLPK
jgi:hypothetical protein